MKYLYLLILPFVLTGCLEEKVKTAPVNPICFDVVSLPSKTILSPILLNKCTGETWIALTEPDKLEKGQDLDTVTYKWFRMERYAIENSVIDDN